MRLSLVDLKARTDRLLFIVPPAAAFVALTLLPFLPSTRTPILLVPISGLSLAAATDVLRAVDSRVVAPGPITGSLVVTAAPGIVAASLSSGFLPLAWASNSCGETA